MCGEHTLLIAAFCLQRINILLKMTKIKLGLAALLVAFSICASAQQASMTFGKGLSFMAKDSSMSMKLTFRFQTLFVAEQTLNDKGQFQNDFESFLNIRRSRIKMDGFVYNPKLVYKIELALSNRDIGLGSINGDEVNFNAASSIVLDAVLKWRFAKHTELWFGQTKLPGNRERVISSQKLQFVDRSLLNNQFNLDRDVGIHLRNQHEFGEHFVVREIACISLGEGRNVTTANDDGFAYTGRVEVLPFGEFASEGDYVGSDISREAHPKLSVAVTYDFNNDSRRTRGQLGSFIDDDSLIRDTQSIHADFMYKHRGFSMMGEYATRYVENADPSVYYVGNAYSIQAGYLFKCNFEVAGRFTQLNPDKWDPENLRLIDGTQTNQYTLGVSKYIVGHNLKIQSDLSSTAKENDDNRYLMYRFQVEMQF